MSAEPLSDLDLGLALDELADQASAVALACHGVALLIETGLVPGHTKCHGLAMTADKLAARLRAFGESPTNALVRWQAARSPDKPPKEQV